MPYPFIPQQGISARGGNNIILERPDMSALLGAVCATWGSIDNILFDIFNLITFSVQIPVGAHSKEKMSEIVFSSLRSYPAQKDLIEKILKYKYQPEVLERFIKVNEIIKKKSKGRNVLVHSEWQISDTYPEDLIITGSPEWTRYTKKCFEQILNESIIARNEINDFFIYLSHQSSSQIE